MKALYRKYRPTKIADVIGQEQVTKPLSSALKSGKISHSYLFTGPRGCGKTSVARIFAHEVNHFPYEVEDSYTDIIEIDAASNTGVDNIRELREKAAIAPSQGKYKIYIIDEVHMLSKSAFNALLKTLEEPPAHVIFIMATTDAYKVPITITSRAQVYNFQLAPPSIMSKHLQKIAKSEKIPIENDALDIIVSRGGGSFRDSISLLDQISTLSDNEAKITRKDVENALGLPEEENCQSLLDAYQKNDSDKTISILKDTLNSGIKPEILAENLIAKIIENPSAELLPLLSKLTEVKSPFSEAKILLAFLGEDTPRRTTSVVNSALSARTTIKTPPSSTKTNGDNSKHQSATPSQSTPESPKIASRASKNTSEPTKDKELDLETTAPSDGFDWELYKDAVSKVNLGIASTLNKCSYSLSGTNLQIVTERKIHKTILSSTNNIKVLQKYLPTGIALEIIDASEISANSQKFNQISDIMGNITEVKSDGVPF